MGKRVLKSRTGAGHGRVIVPISAAGVTNVKTPRAYADGRHAPD